MTILVEALYEKLLNIIVSTQLNEEEKINYFVKAAEEDQVIFAKTFLLQEFAEKEKNFHLKDNSSIRKSLTFTTIEMKYQKLAIIMLELVANIDEKLIYPQQSPETNIKVFVKKVINQETYPELHILNLAAKLGQKKLVKKLLYFGTDIDISRRLGTALTYAVFEGHLEIVEFLAIQGADPNKKGWEDKTPLHVIPKQNKLKIFQALYRVGANIDAQEKHLLTALHLAAITNEPEIAQLLIKFGAKTNLLNEAGQTPLHLAINHGHIEVVKILLNASTSKASKEKLDLTIKDNHGDNCLNLATSLASQNEPTSCHHQILKLIKKYLTKQSSELLKVKSASIPGNFSPNLTAKKSTFIREIS